MESLVRLSARLGRDSLLAQASTGNTSLKVGGTLWIKASGKSLAQAAEPGSFVPVNIAKANAYINRHEPPVADPDADGEGSGRCSIETAMHTVLPHRVVLHVHSVQAISWAVQENGPALLNTRLAGLPWTWIPYVDSGLPLAREMKRALTFAPESRIFLLANHGLVICGDSCDEADAMLNAVEARLATPPRHAPPPREDVLHAITRISEWRMPEAAALHSLGTDPISRKILKAGILYPCQAIFLGSAPPFVPCSVPLSAAVRCGGPYLILEGAGIVVSRLITAAEYATLIGLMEVVRRLDSCTPIRYLSEMDVRDLLCEEVSRYRDSVDQQMTGQPIATVPPSFHFPASRSATHTGAAAELPVSSSAAQR